MDEEQLEEAKQRLLEMREQVLEDSAKAYAASQELGKDGVPDIGDMSSNSYTQEVLMNLSETQRSRVRDIDAALERMDKGVYGNMSTMNPPYSPMLWSSSLLQSRQVLITGLWSELAEGSQNTRSLPILPILPILSILSILPSSGKGEKAGTQKETSDKNRKAWANCAATAVCQAGVLVGVSGCLWVHAFVDLALHSDQSTHDALYACRRASSCEHQT